MACSPLDLGTAIIRGLFPILRFNPPQAGRVESAWDLGAIRKEIERSHCAIDTAGSNFEEVIDPTMIDCYIYELNAAQLRYQFLLRKFKSREA